MNGDELNEKDELLPEYDFSRMAGGLRGKHAIAYRGGTNLARLDPDVVAAFDTDLAVNEALRAIPRGAPKGPGDLETSPESTQCRR
ncbi:MAG: hypothetical protein K0U98_08345 [Deltaproteobacteria bacterium]|nr:hypothetical protein [Deltaproteobacteria bacterium]